MSAARLTKAGRQMLAELEKERAALLAQMGELEARLGQLDAGLAGLRALNGQGPAAAARPRHGKVATGTKALILDALADGRPRSSSAIAEVIKVTRSGAGFHLRELVATGDVVVDGRARATRYRIP